MSPASNSVRQARPLLGTFVEITVAGASDAKMQEAVDAAFDAVAEIHRLMSFHDEQSELRLLNREAGSRPVTVNVMTYKVLQAALDLCQRSDGLFDVTIVPALKRLGILPLLDTDPPVSSNRTPGVEMIELLSNNRVRFADRRTQLDLGGIAKGFAVDRAIEVLCKRQMPQAFVNAGGDVRAAGSALQTVHIRNPQHPDRLLCQIEIRDQALASSGPRFDPVRSAGISGCAIVDPTKQQRAEQVAAATVRATTCVIADALTKVVMIAGHSATELLEHYGASALLVSADGSVSITPDLLNTVRLAA